MKLGLKPKILLALVGILALTATLHAALASYFTNRQNEASAFADLNRGLIEWRHDLNALRHRLRQRAIDAVNDAVELNTLDDLVSLEFRLDELRVDSRESQDATRALGYRKSTSLGRLHLVQRSGGFSSIAVYVNGKLSHYLSESEAGMMIPRAQGDDVWLTAPADRGGSLPLQRWPSWVQGAVPALTPVSMPSVKQSTVSLEFFTPETTTLQIAIPVAGVIQNLPADSSVQEAERVIAEPAIPEQKSPAAPAPGANGAPVTFSVIVFRKDLDRALLDEVAQKTGKWPALFSPDGRHRQQLVDFNFDPAQVPRPTNASDPPGLIHRTVQAGEHSMYVALVPWAFDEQQQPLILGLASSRETTLANIRQTVTAIGVAAGLILLISIGAGIFWVGRFINPIVALTSAVKEVGRKSPEGLRPIPTHAPDEVGDLTAAFNAMIAELRGAIETLEQRVQERTADLRQQTRYLRTLIDTLPAQIWLKDTESRFLAVNQACAEAGGHKVEDLVGKTDLDIWPRELAEAYRADDREVMQTRQRKQVEEPIALATGTIWLETEKAPVIDEDGTVIGTVGVGRNISDRKNVEAAREAALAEAVRLARLRSEFLARMSHELRTPLNAILGYAQILQRDGHLTATRTSGLATIQESGRHLLALINDILDFSRIEAAKMELSVTDVSLADFLEVVADIIRVRAEQKNLVFIYDAAADLPAVVYADARRLRQVLLNLLGNAVKFTDEGHVALRVRVVAAGEPATARIRFEVEDSGIGMTPDQFTRIFRPFEQVTEMHRREGGAGLGLAISRELVRLMGGDIDVKSTLGAGSVFSFELDLAVGSSAASTQRMPQVAQSAAGEPRTEPHAVRVADADLVVPPPHEIQVLHQLALAGNMRDIRERAAYLKNLDARYAPFADRLESLARRYQSLAILALIERCREQQDSERARTG